MITSGCMKTASDSMQRCHPGMIDEFEFFLTIQSWIISCLDKSAMQSMSLLSRGAAERAYFENPKNTILDTRLV
jgi:hypothetical protein